MIFHVTCDFLVFHHMLHVIPSNVLQRYTMPDLGLISAYTGPAASQRDSGGGVGSCHIHSWKWLFNMISWDDNASVGQKLWRSLEALAKKWDYRVIIVGFQ